MKGVWLIVVGMMSSSLYGAIGDAPDAFLKKLQAELHKKGDPWIAGKTSVSDLSLAEKKNLLGLLPRSETPMIKTSDRRSVKVLADLDWRSNNGNWMTPVKNQGNCGSCWAFGWIAAHEARTNIFHSDINEDPDLSEQYVLSCNPYGYNCNGGRMDIGDWVIQNGIPDEACYPYTATNGN